MRASRAAVGRVVFFSLYVGAALGGAKPSQEDLGSVGRELFLRQWVAGDPRSRGGDGLGPVFNATSCVACHHQGGTGGAGPNDRNVELITPFTEPSADDKGPTGPELAELIKARFGLRALGSSVLHRFGTDPSYPAWRGGMSERAFPTFTLRKSERNTPPLFGAGLIDAIPEALLEEEARRRFLDFPEVQGRVCRLKGGKIGRFGWKAQTASLEDFVLTACSVEIGLEVPGHGQVADPLAPQSQARGLDMTGLECDALVAYVRRLPIPGQREPFSSVEAQNLAAGRAIFAAVGCATCHSPRFGLYSDLLLHDMGEGLADASTYYGAPRPGEEITEPSAVLVDAEAATGEVLGATRQEWRTPPLWGFRDSGPYLHDGRAANLEQAVSRHGGEAADTTRRYARLAPLERAQVQTFLMSLTAPPAPRAGKPKAEPRRTVRTTRGSPRSFQGPMPPSGAIAGPAMF